MDQVGANVRTYRMARGWSKAQLAQMVGYANATMIHQIEEGLKQPSSQQLQVLARVLGVTVSDLVGDRQAPVSVTNTANGDHQRVYQHVEGSILMLEEVQESVRAIVREELQASRDLLVAEIRMVLREAAREADTDGEGEA